jgi:hypothetical protein
MPIPASITDTAAYPMYIVKAVNQHESYTVNIGELYQLSSDKFNAMLFTIISGDI